MFKDLIKELENIDGKKISIGIDSDENGYIDKQCPSDDCKFIFKVNEEDWGNIFSDAAVWCPLCRNEDPADKWFTLEQVEHFKAEALTVVKGKVNNALRNGAREFNRSQSRDGFLSITMKVGGGTKRTHTIPASAAEIMQLEIQCEKCDSRFAVIGSAYFCPCCGHNSVTRTFYDSLRKIKAKKESIYVIRDALDASVGKDEAELTCRSIIETCISDGVSAFQKYCEGMYEPYGNIPFNAFQRLKQASELWKGVIQKGFDIWLSNEEFNSLNILYQKRHLLAHNEGMVDSRYMLKSGDESYKEGQRIVVSERDVEFLVSVLEKLGKAIEVECSKEQSE